MHRSGWRQGTLEQYLLFRNLVPYSAQRAEPQGPYPALWAHRGAGEIGITSDMRGEFIPRWQWVEKDHDETREEKDLPPSSIPPYKHTYPETQGSQMGTGPRRHNYVSYTWWPLGLTGFAFLRALWDWRRKDPEISVSFCHFQEKGQGCPYVVFLHQF